MDEAVELGSYLPFYFHSTDERDYIGFLWDAFETNYTHDKYQFAFLAYHMLLMSFVYFNLWRIKKTWPEDFRKGLIGFARYEKDLLTEKSPFSFSKVPEQTVLRFPKLIACNNGQVHGYAAFVKIRNDIAHANGNIFFRTQAALDDKIGEILQAVDDIQTQSKPVIEHCYQEFLLQSYDPEEREYPDAADQIREVLIQGNYMSQKDVEICIRSDIAKFCGQVGFTEMQALHHCLLADYGDVDHETA